MQPDTPLYATIHLAFAFDLGYEIDLERARPLLAGEAGALARRRRTPESIRYRPAPLRVALDASGQATLTVNGLGVGNHSVDVTYGGDANFNASATAS